MKSIIQPRIGANSLERSLSEDSAQCCGVYSIANGKNITNDIVNIGALEPHLQLFSLQKIWNIDIKCLFKVEKINSVNINTL